jgi:hypothetical protein
MERTEVQRIIDDFFIASTDFNGISLSELCRISTLPEADLKSMLKELVVGGTCSLQWSGNPHIIRIAHRSVEEQLGFLAEQSIQFGCAYPTRERIKTIRDPSPFVGRPYARRLAFAEPQLELAYFEMDVLERYFNDPRYSCRMDDYQGRISITGQDSSPRLAEKDEVILQSFGIGYAKDKRRVICVVLRYMNDLTPEHQEYWRSKEVDHDRCYPFPYYYANAVLGEWSFCLSLFSAFLQEIRLINALATHIFGRTLFVKTFEGNRPIGFGYLLSPTSKHFEDFILLLDKMLNENMDVNFFDDKVPLEVEVEMSDGRFRVDRKNSIRLLDEWLSPMFASVPDYKEILIDPLKKVRRMRQDPAHRIAENRYDPAFIDQQTDVMDRVLGALMNIRHHLQRHIDAQNFQTPNWYRKDEIIRI